mgnify:CR=1 FL=1
MAAEGYAAIDNQREACSWGSSNENFTTHRALLASRIHSLEELKGMVKIDFFPKDTVDKTATKYVCLTYSSMGKEISAVLREGIDQGELVKAKDGSLSDKIGILFKSPYSIKYRDDLRKIYILARRRRQLYGDVDKAFYDIAVASVKKINTIERAYFSNRDSSDKGYINTFNHVTSQAIITSIFGQNKAAFIADVHERYNMPQLTSSQKIDSLMLEGQEKAVIDNYVDIVNNKIGQKLGIVLGRKYKINRNSEWSPKLLTDYLNDMHQYYRLTYGIGMKPFNEQEELILLFSRKINNTIATN